MADKPTTAGSHFDVVIAEADLLESAKNVDIN